MTDYTESFPISLTSNIQTDAEVSVQSLMNATVSMAAGLGIRAEVRSDLIYMIKYVGEEGAPQDIKRLRSQVHDLMRRMGQPVIIKKLLTINDVDKNYAERSANYDSIYGQTRNNDNLSWGAGFVSKEKSKNEWINPTSGQIVLSDTAPDPSWPKAPKYRGYGPGIVTYIIEPDAPQDYFTLTPTGAMMQVQTSEVTMGWYPKINDGDLIIHVELDDHGNIIESSQRYQAKMTTPVSMRGLDRRGRKEYSGDLGNRHIINQNFPITLVPENNVLMKVEIDR
jgi:hypothetical protein